MNISLTNDDNTFADLRDQNIALLPQLLQKKLYETQSIKFEWEFHSSGNNTSSFRRSKSSF